MTRMTQSDRIEASVSVGVCVERRGSLLMVQKKETGLWGIPGGHLLPEETPLQGARREVLEEAGIPIIPFALVGIYYFPKKKGASICFVVRAYVSPTAAFSPQDIEVKKVEWKDASWVRYAITSGELYRPEYLGHNLMDWLSGALIPLTLLREFSVGWAE